MHKIIHGIITTNQIYIYIYIYLGSNYGEPEKSRHQVVRQVHSALENRGNRDIGAAPGCAGSCFFGDNGVPSGEP